MKTRSGFVSNSSSSSFILTVNNPSDTNISISEWAEKNKEHLYPFFDRYGEDMQELIDKGEDPFDADWFRSLISSTTIVKPKSKVIIHCITGDGNWCEIESESSTKELDDGTILGYSGGLEQ